MKRRIIYIIAFTFLNINLFSQNEIKNVISEIENNNTMLTALRSSMEAEKIGNRTGNFLQNPEVEFHYLWSDPASMGNRTDISITQGFDFPTAYKHRNDISELKDQQVEIEYLRQLKDLRFEVRKICLKLIYSNALRNEYVSRRDHASEIAAYYKTKYESGESNIIEYNKIQLVNVSAGNKLSMIEMEIDELNKELSSLNGGKSIDFLLSNFPEYIIPEDFDSWYAEAEIANPVLNWIKQEIEINRAREKYSKAMSMPKIEAGYMSEAIVGEQFQGLIVGMSIPLWENKNTVKHAKGNTVAYQDLELDKKTEYYNHLKSLYSKAVMLKNNVDSYRNELSLLSNIELLKKALDSGEISLIEYVYEFSIYYESIDNLLDMELELNQTLAKLNQYS